MADYKTEDERARERERNKANKIAADERIAMMKKEHDANCTKLRNARKEKAEADKKAKEATLAANAKSATFPMFPAHYIVGPGTPIVACATALADGRIGSKEDVVSWVASGVGFLGAIGAALTGNPTGALVMATVMGGGLASAGSRRTRAWGERMRAEAHS